MKNKVTSHIFVASLALLLIANAFANISSATHQRTTTSTTTTSTGTGFAETFSLQNGVVVNDAQQTSDGGYILAGSVDYVSSQTHALLIKLDSSGNIRWSENYGTNLKNTGTDTESATAVRQTSDGG